MCGHVGIAGRLEFKDEATLKRLLLMDYFRGTDSTGVAAIRKDGATPIAKIASHPIDLFDTKAYEKVNHAYQTKVFIGHNRAATKGKVNGINAHPYQYGHIIGAHNGTLEHSSWKALNDVLGYETDVDSMAIFACIEKIGIEETVKLLSGAWALVWVDLEEGKLKFLRNKERPMWYAHTADFDKLFWASEWPMIQAATEMAAPADSYEMYADKDGYLYFPMEEDHLYEYDIDTMVKGLHTELPTVKGPKLEGKAPAPVVKHTYNNGTSPFVAGTAGKTTTTNSRGGNTTPDYITMITNAEKPFANFLTKERFLTMSEGKCTYCLEPVHFEDEGLVVFENLEGVLCGDCSGHTTSRFMATPKTYFNHIYSEKKEKVA